MIVLLVGAPGIGKTTLLQALSARMGCPAFEMSWMPEFLVKNGNAISYEEDERIAADTLLLVGRNYLKHGHRIVLLSDFTLRLLPWLLSSTTPEERLPIKLIIRDDAELTRRVLDPSRSNGYRHWEEALRINRDLQVPLAADEVVCDITGKTLAEEIDLLVACIDSRLSSQVDGRQEHTP